MSTTTISHTVSQGRPRFYTLVERIAIGMLRWSEHRAEVAAACPAEARRVFVDYGRGPRCVEFLDAHERAIEANRTRRFF